MSYTTPAVTGADSGSLFRCIVGNAYGRDTSTAALLRIFAPPRAAFGASPLAGAAPLAVTFADSSSGTVASRRWDFGDNAVDSVRSPLHTYSKPGVYSVKLWVGGPGGADSIARPSLIHVSDTTVPVNDLRVTLASVGDSAVAASWKIDTTQKNAVAIYAGLAPTSAQAADSTRYPYRDSSFVIRNVKTPGQWRLAYFLSDSVNKKSVVLFDTVTIANTPPRIVRPISKLNATDDAIWTDTVSAFDLNADPLRYSLVVGPPAIFVDSLGGRLSWNPGPVDIGVTVVVVSAATAGVA